MFGDKEVEKLYFTTSSRQLDSLVVAQAKKAKQSEKRDLHVRNNSNER